VVHRTTNTGGFAVISALMSELLAAAYGQSRVLAARAGAGVIASRIRLSCRAAENGFDVSVTYGLRNLMSHDDRALALDLTPCPFVIDSVSSDAASVVPSRQVRRRDVLFLALNKGARWDGAEVRFDLHWETARDDVPVMVAPEWLPRIMHSSRVEQQLHGEPQPDIELTAPLPDSLQLAGLFRQGNGSLLQLIITPVLRERLSRTNITVGLSEAVAHTLSQQVRARTVDALLKLIDHAGRWWGVNPAVDAVAMLDREIGTLRLAPWGACLLGQEEWFDRLQRSAIDVSMMRLVSRLWWGVGCRLVGEGADELATSLGRAYGLEQLRVAGNNDQVDVFRAASDQGRREPIVRDWWRRRTGQPAVRTLSTYTLALLDALAADSGFPSVLAGLTREFWGRYVHVGTLLSRLNIS
jgi:hypothetical protein